MVYNISLQALLRQNEATRKSLSFRILFQAACLGLSQRQFFLNLHFFAIGFESWRWIAAEASLAHPKLLAPSNRNSPIGCQWSRTTGWLRGTIGIEHAQLPSAKNEGHVGLLIFNLSRQRSWPRLLSTEAGVQGRLCPTLPAGCWGRQERDTRNCESWAAVNRWPTSGGQG